MAGGTYDWKREPTRGPIPLGEFQRIDDAANRDVEAFGGVPGDMIADAHIASQLTPHHIQGFWARISDNSTAPIYSFVRVIRDPDDLTETDDDTMEGTLNAVEVNLNAYVAVGTIVWVLPAETRGGETWQFTFNASQLLNTEPDGVIDGVNDTFESLCIPQNGATSLVFRNGLLQKEGTDYTISGTTITFLAGSIPQVGDIIRVICIGITNLGGGGAGTIPDSSIYLPEEKVRCEQGILRVYSRNNKVAIVSGVLTVTPGLWSARSEGCCDCPEEGSGGGDPCVPGTCSECDEAPYEWTVPVFGFTGTCGDMFNRTWHLIQDDPAVDCEWYEDVQVLGGTARCVLTISGGIATVSFQFGAFEPLTEIASYEAAITGDCCEELTFTQVSCACAADLAVDDCTPCGATTPESWDVVIAGATGCFAGLNGHLTIPANTGFPCSWQLFDPGVMVATVTFGGDNELFLFLLLADQSRAYYRSVDPVGDCCSPVTMTQWQVECEPSSASGDVPATVTLVPSCSTPASSCPDEIHAVAECCTGSAGEGSGSGSGGGSGGGDVTVVCCDVPVPRTLYVTLLNGTGNCSCMDSGPHSLVWNGTGWAGTATFCGGPQNLALECLFGGLWQFQSVTAGIPYCLFVGTATADSCSPLSITFLNMSNSGNCCDVGETIDAIVTEA